jgi:transposase
MSNKIFSKGEIELLSKNKFVKKVSEKGITYSDEFKRLFIAESEKGKPARKIFEDSGFDIDVIGYKRFSSSVDRWRRAYKENGVVGLNDSRKENSGRPSEKELSIEEKYERLKAQINLLKAENELLKKLDMLERKAKKK